MKYKKWVAVASSLALAPAVAACGGSSATGDGPVELVMWTGFTGGDRAAYEDLVSAFNDSHDDIKVTMEVQPWDTLAQKLPAAWATGQGPDLATPNFNPSVLAEYEANGSLLPITNLGEGEGQINVDQLAPAAVEAFTLEQDLVAVPANFATLQLYYNKKHFADAGIDAPPSTVEEFKSMAKDLTKDGVYGLSLADHETIQMWPLLQWMDGSDIVDENGCSVLDEEASIASLTEWANLVSSGVAPVGLTGAESDSLFSSGKAAMQLNGPWAAAGYEEAGIDLGVAPVPTGEEGPVTLAATVPLAASAKTEHPDEVQEFMAWWTGAEAQEQFSLASGFPPARTDLAEDSDLQANETVATFAAGVPHARLYLGGVPNATKVDGEVYVPLIGEITRGADVSEAVQNASEQIDQLTNCQGQ